MTKAMIGKHIKAIVFDAVGTLLFPESSAGDVYAVIGRRFGSAYGQNEIKQRFAEAFAREEAIDQQHDWKTGEKRERDRWLSIVSRVLDDVQDPASCFDELYEHFARPQAWRCLPQTDAALRSLKDRGLIVGLASNFDHRLHSVLAGTPELGCLDPIIISAEVGWRKPAAHFFSALCDQICLTPSQVLFVGDDLQNDYHGAAQAGCDVLLFDPKAKHENFDGPRLKSLADLVG